MSVVLMTRHGQAAFGVGDYDQLSDLGRAQARHLAGVLASRGQSPDRIVCGSLQRQQESAEILSTLLGGAAIHVDERWNEYDFMPLIVRVKPMYRRHWVMIADLARTGNPQRRLQQVIDQALHAWVDGVPDPVADPHVGEGLPVGAERIGESDVLVDPRDGSLVQRPANAVHPMDVEDDRDVESFGSFQARVDAALDEASARQGTTLVVSSAGTISAAARPLLGLPARRWPDLQRIVLNGSITKVVRGRRGLTLISFNEHGHMEGEAGAGMTYR